MSLAPDQILTDEESASFFASQVEQHPRLSVKIPFTSLGHILEHNPEELVAGLKCPILIVGAEKDTVCPISESRILFERARDPKGFTILTDCRHYDAYEGDPFEKAMEATLSWFSEHL